MSIRKCLLLVVFSVVFVSFLHSAAGQNALAFLKIGVGPSASGLGEAYSVLAQGAEATYWNPAGIVSTRKNEVYLYHNSWIEGISQQYISAVVHRPQRDISYGLSAMFLNTGNMPYREIIGDQPHYSLVYSSYSAKNLAIVGSFSKMLNNYSYGFNLKIIEEKIHTYSTNVIAFDFGMNFYNVTDRLNLSFVVQNFGTQAKFDKESFDIPLTFRAGSTFSGLVYERDYDLAFDLVKTINESIGYRLGAQVHLPYQITLRTGYNTCYDIGTKFNLGFGKRFGSIDFNYAWTPSSLVDDAHKISLGYTW